MASRMEKYHSNSLNTSKRSVRNEGLYRDIYENNKYSNIAGVATLDKTNEISLEQIQDLLREREEIKKRKTIPVVENTAVRKPVVEERNYDIRDILVKAKVEHVDDNPNRKLNEKYNILRSINVKDDTLVDNDLEKTLVNTSVLKGFNDNELSLDMLSDLKSTGNTIVSDNVDGKFLKEVNEAKDSYQVSSDDSIDKSFYTSGLGFKEEDFEQLKDIQDSIESNNKLIKFLFFVLFLIIAGVLIFILYKLI